MTPIPENALPNYDKRTIEDPSVFFRTLFHLRDIKEERAIPAVVKDYDAKTGEVTVLPMAKYTFDTRDGEAEVDRETVKVRALRICQGGYSISLPIFKGDTGWLIAGDRRCGAAIEKNGEIVVRDLTDEELKDKTAKPDDCSILNFENGFFIPFSWSVESIGDEKSLIIRNVSKGEELNLENNHGVCGTYPWSMIEVRRDGTVNTYGQGRKFTVRKEGLYLDDKPLKFLDDLILKEGEGIEIGKTILEDGKIQYVIGNKGVIALEEGDNITIEPVDKNPGVFRVSSSGGVKSITIDSPDESVSVEKGGTDEDQQFHLRVVHPQIGNGIITIRRNGMDVGSFSMNQSGNGEINIEVPDVNYPVTSVEKKADTFGLDVNPTTGDVKIENTGITGAHIQQSGAARHAQITGGTDTTHNDVSVKTKDVTITLPVPLDIDATTFKNVLENAIHVTLTQTGSAETLDLVEKISLALNLDAANHSIKINGNEVAKFFGTSEVDIPAGGAQLDHTFSWEGVKKADIAASDDIAVDSKKIQGIEGITVSEANRIITIKGSGTQISGYTTPAGTYDYEVTGQEWDSTNHRIVIHKVKKTYKNGLLDTREAIADEYIQFVEETV